MADWDHLHAWDVEGHERSLPAAAPLLLPPPQKRLHVEVAQREGEVIGHIEHSHTPGTQRAEPGQVVQFVARKPLAISSTQAFVK